MGAFVQSLGGTALDASVLAISVVGLIPPNDPRIQRTIDGVRRELGTGELVRRYRGGDELAGDVGAFIVCAFWLVNPSCWQGGLRRDGDCLRPC